MPEVTPKREIKISIGIDWPEVTVTVQDGERITQDKRWYDIALSGHFSTMVLNSLARAINEVVQKEKEKVQHGKTQR